MDFGHHLVQVLAEFVDNGLVPRGNEDAGRLFTRDPAVFHLLQRKMPLRKGNKAYKVDCKTISECII